MKNNDHQQMALNEFLLEIHPLIIAISDKKIQQWQGFLEVSAYHLLQYLKTKVYTLQNKQEAESMIQHQQAALIEMINELQSFIKQVDTTSKQGQLLITFYMEVTNIVQSTLNYILQHFSKYLNLQLNVPASYLPVVKKEIEERVSAIRENLSNVETVHLLAIAMEPLTAFLEDATAKITYRRLQYYMALIEELSVIHPEDDVKCAIRTSLVYLNFNSKAFEKYSLEFLLSEEDYIENEIERRDKLLWIIKSMKQLQVKPGAILYEDRPSVYDYMLKYAREEFEYLQFKLQEHGETLQAASGKEERETKIDLSSNLSVFAGILKVFMEAGFIANRKKMDVLRVMADSHRVNRKPVSLESLRTLYNNVDFQTGKAVIDIFFQLLNKARSMY
ncbi:MAG: hypothetical protein EPN39_00265 [Chitinophagaceae bacterium]|nr:MAG: hypothetical protein EPN39_00265 [Chitinophagaceae bacterium]